MTPSSETPYVPAPHLIARSGLTASQLTAQFEDFRSNIQYISAAPSLLFERLVGNLSEEFQPVVGQDSTHRVCSSCHTPTGYFPDNQQDANEPAGPRPKNPTIGTFYSGELRKGKVRDKAPKAITFASPHIVPPGLPVGLTMIDIGRQVTPRVKAYPSNVHREGFSINLETWAGTLLYGASCAWLEIAANDPDFQSGSYSTLEDHSWFQHETHNTRRVTFRRPYQTPPIVMVCLSAIDMSNERRWRIRTFATNITKTGFTIHIDTWDDSLLWSAAASWVAYTATKTGVASGHFSTTDIRSPKQHMRDNTGYEEFETGIFKDPPRVFMALDSFDIDHGDTLRVTAYPTNVSTAGMTWNLNTWRNSGLYSAGASYIALS